MKDTEKMLQARVDEAFHGEVLRYASANNRSVQMLIRHALRFYMNAHPIGSAEAPGDWDDEE